MRRPLWLMTGVGLLLSLVLLSCGYVKKDELEKQMSVQRRMFQDATAEANNRADRNLEVARKEIAKAKEEAIAAAMEKDAETLVEPAQLRHRHRC